MKPGGHAFWRSSTLRLLLLVFVVQIVSAAAILLFVRSEALAESERQSRAVVAALDADLLATWRQRGTAGLDALIDARVAGARSRDDVMLLVDAGGRVRAGNLAAWPPTVPPVQPWQTLELFRIGGATPERMGVSATPLGDGSRLLVGHVMDGDVRLARIIEEAMLAALLLALPIALVAAGLVARIIGGRVNQVAVTAGSIDAADLSRRVPIAGSGDAFDAVAAAVNAMLDRIETLVTELRIVTDGLAHDLRAPITRLKAVLDAAVARTTDPQAADALDRVGVEADALLAILGTALQISRAEAGIGRERFEPVDIATLLDDLAEVYGPVAEEDGMRLDSVAEAGLVLPVHRQLLAQAIANLIDNGFKYGRHAGGAIALSAARDGDRIRIAVADGGPGIAADRREEALRRFGRLDPARHVGGAGLGLSLVAAVAKLHGGTLVLEDNAPGLRAVLMLRTLSHREGEGPAA